MTYKEKLKNILPEKINHDVCGGCLGCPGDYFPGGARDGKCGHVPNEVNCAVCWNTEIPLTKKEEKENNMENTTTTKTKEQLEAEIESLKAQLAAQEQYKQVKSAADQAMIVMKALMDAGFNEIQAFELIKMAISSRIRG